MNFFRSCHFCEPLPFKESHSKATSLGVLFFMVTSITMLMVLSITFFFQNQRLHSSPMFFSLTFIEAPLSKGNLSLNDLSSYMCSR